MQWIFANQEEKLNVRENQNRVGDSGADRRGGGKTGTLIREYVKFLRRQGADIGEKRMFEDLRNKGYLIKAQGRDRNKPTQKSMELGSFTVREAVIAKPDSETITRTTALLTEKGKQYFAAMYLPVATEAEPAAT